MINYRTPMRVGFLDNLNNHILVFHCKIPPNFSLLYGSNIISTLPIKDQKYIFSIQNRNARIRTLIGRLMLKQVASDLGYPKPLAIQTDPSGKPYFSALPNINFNISHSHQMVVCGLTMHDSIGIDIEWHGSIELSAFKECFRDDEWQVILCSTSPNETFYNFWTRKEALAKADGRGIVINLKSLNVLNNRQIVEGTLYHVLNTSIEKNYSTAIACQNNKPIQFISFNKKLLKINVSSEHKIWR